MTELAQKKCVACEGFETPLNEIEANALMGQVPGWELGQGAVCISRTFKFKDFAQALEFTNSVGAIAETEGHHPDIALSWGKVGIVLTTHAIHGLSENDFIVAAKINESSLVRA
jgi:4a-hydroxytetrahydrobiopterin dehydratase